MKGSDTTKLPRKLSPESSPVTKAFIEAVELGSSIVATFPAVCLTSETGKETTVPLFRTAGALIVWKLKPWPEPSVTEAAAVRWSDGRLTFASTDSETDGLKTVYSGVSVVVILTTPCVLGETPAGEAARAPGNEVERSRTERSSKPR